MKIFEGIHSCPDHVRVLCHVRCCLLFTRLKGQKKIVKQDKDGSRCKLCVWSLLLVEATLMLDTLFAAFPYIYVLPNHLHSPALTRSSQAYALVQPLVLFCSLVYGGLVLWLHYVAFPRFLQPIRAYETFRWQSNWDFHPKRWSISPLHCRGSTRTDGLENVSSVEQNVMCGCKIIVMVIVMMINRIVQVYRCV